MFEIDIETSKLIRLFKRIKEKKVVADSLSALTVKIGLEGQSAVLKHYYDGNEPDFITASCISFGLQHLMEEDFYIVKEVLGYDIVLSHLDKRKKYLEVVNNKVPF